MPHMFGFLSTNYNRCGRCHRNGACCPFVSGSYGDTCASDFFICRFFDSSLFDALLKGLSVSCFAQQGLHVPVCALDELSLLGILLLSQSKGPFWSSESVQLSLNFSGQIFFSSGLACLYSLVRVLISLLNCIMICLVPLLACILGALLLLLCKKRSLAMVKTIVVILWIFLSAVAANVDFLSVLFYFILFIKIKQTGHKTWILLLSSFTYDNSLLAHMSVHKGAVSKFCYCYKANISSEICLLNRNLCKWTFFINLLTQCTSFTEVSMPAPSHPVTFLLRQFFQVQEARLIKYVHALPATLILRNWENPGDPIKLSSCMHPL